MTNDEFCPQWLDDRDDGQAAATDAAMLAEERAELSLSALYHAAMLGLPEDELRHLCCECGLSYRELEQYAPPILRTSNQPDGGAAQDTLPF